MLNLAKALVCFVIALLFAMATAQMENEYGAFCLQAWCTCVLAIIALIGAVWHMARLGND